MPPHTNQNNVYPPVQAQYNSPPPPYNPNQSPSPSDGRDVERFLMIILFFITFFQFAMWGTQSVRFLLHTAYGTGSVNTTPLDFFIGLVAMLAAALVFAGSVMWWRKNYETYPLIQLGTSFFIFKNVLDAINIIWIFNISAVVITEGAVDKLAVDIGMELFQLAFWAFVMFYFRQKYREYQSS
jgi:hypothetical protein